jgi:hypothetical protein
MNESWFHVGELVRLDRRRLVRGGSMPLVVLMERQASGLLWLALFPDGVVYQVGTESLSKVHR